MIGCLRIGLRFLKDAVLFCHARRRRETVPPRLQIGVSGWEVWAFRKILFSTRIFACLATGLQITLLFPAMKNDLLDRITTNPNILAGKPIIRGMRISVEQVLKALSGNVSAEELLAEYPELEPDDIRAVLVYAANLVAGEKVYSIPA